MTTIWLAEDEPKIAAVLIDYLKASGYKTRYFESGDALLPAFDREKPDMILLDVMMPGKRGTQICRELRAVSQVPIILITARVEEADRIGGLELGADDYICKPFSPREVLARIKTVLRRSGRSLEAPPKNPFRIDSERFEISLRGRPLSLTRNEFNLLKTLLRKPGRVFSREQLLEHIHRDFRDVTDRAVDSHIKNLRKKLNEAEPDLDCIFSVYGVGYKLEL